MVYNEYAQYTTTGKPPQLPDEILVQHSCGALCQNYAISHLITFRHREYLRSNFTRLFSERVLDRRIYKSLDMKPKPDTKAALSPILSQIKQTTARRVEDIVKTKLGSECEDCKEEYVSLWAVLSSRRSPARKSSRRSTSSSPSPSTRSTKCTRRRAQEQEQPRDAQLPSNRT